MTLAGELEELLSGCWVHSWDCVCRSMSLASVPVVRHGISPRTRSGSLQNERRSVNGFQELVPPLPDSRATRSTKGFGEPGAYLETGPSKRVTLPKQLAPMIETPSSAFTVVVTIFRHDQLSKTSPETLVAAGTVIHNFVFFSAVGAPLEDNLPAYVERVLDRTLREDLWSRARRLRAQRWRCCCKSYSYSPVIYDALAERFVPSIKSECLSRMIFFGQALGPCPWSVFST